IHSYCGAGKSLLQADTKTNLYTCNWLMNDESEAVSTNNWPVIAETLIEKNNCQTCWARHLCGGGCMAVHKAKSGSKHEKDPAFCYRQRSLSAISIEYFFEALNLKNDFINETNNEIQTKTATTIVA
ncbi:MAG: SPASM domain-containing protein, partial [Bdellovibrionota bacterium]